MVTKFYCEFCGKEFIDVTKCVEHERSHNSLFIDAESVTDYGLSTSGNRIGTAPALVYVPLFKRDENNKIIKMWGRYSFITVLSPKDFAVLVSEGEIIE